MKHLWQMYTTDQRIYLEDPKPVVPQRKSKRGKAPSRLKAQTQATCVDEFVQYQPSNAWQENTRW
ncbi:hypothetical protein QUF74_17620 [Candidatus Halobeggiatoa sp. HSG11]|nr:hypothetical protein [Candidatus Halobeggiatoa sp. HSG11]